MFAEMFLVKAWRELGVGVWEASKTQDKENGKGIVFAGGHC